MEMTFNELMREQKINGCPSTSRASARAIFRLFDECKVVGGIGHKYLDQLIEVAT